MTEDSDQAAESPIFPGSEAGKHVIEWIDGLLTDLHDGRLDAARDALAADDWRGRVGASGVPAPILDLAAREIDAAAAALRAPTPSPEDAERALLSARAHFLPGG